MAPDDRRDATQRFGKGRHSAGLNFGDCMSYAVALVEGLPLLWVGEDLGRTDAVGARLHVAVTAVDATCRRTTRPDR